MSYEETENLLEEVKVGIEEERHEGKEYKQLYYKINLLSIPRDTLIEVPGYGWQKVNQAYFLGGSKMATQAVEKFLNIKIDKHVVVNPRGIINIIDLLGGMKNYVDKDMHYVDK